VHRALAGLPRLGVLAEVAEHEREQEVRVGVVRVELDRPPERGEGLLGRALIVERLADVEVQDRAVRIDLERATEPEERIAQPAARLLGEAQLESSPRTSFGRAWRIARNSGSASSCWPSSAKARPRSSARHGPRGAAGSVRAARLTALVVVPGVEVRDLEVALGDPASWVELERLREAGDGLLVEPLVEVEDDPRLLCAPASDGSIAPRETRRTSRSRSEMRVTAGSVTRPGWSGGSGAGSPGRGGAGRTRGGAPAPPAGGTRSPRT
jgi:hypothetical protein